MIKVNLLRNRIADPGTSAGTSAANVADGDDSSKLRNSLVKVACILLFTIAIMMYESQNIRALNEEQARLAAQTNQLQAELAAKQNEVDAVKDIEVQARELEDKLKILKLLSRLRLREVKTLDFMQSSIPEKVWLKGITYDSDKIKVEQGHFVFVGNAVATEELTEFVKRLEDSAYLQDVIVVKNQEQAVGKSTAIREFLFTAEVETKN